jgi:hypothetical protein
MHKRKVIIYDQENRFKQASKQLAVTKKTKSKLYEMKSSLKVISLLFILPTFVAAQPKRDSLLNPKALLPLIFKKNHLGISIMHIVGQKSTVTGSSFPYNQGSNSHSGLQFGLQYQINFGVKHSIITGAMFNMMGRNFTFFIPKESFVPTADADVNYTRSRGSLSAVTNLAVPILFEKRWIIKKHFFSALAGTELHFNLDGGGGGYIYPTARQNGNFITIGNIFTNNDEDKLLQAGAVVGAGFGYVTKRNNTKTFRLIGKLNFNDRSISSYTLNVQSQPTVFGNIITRGSYIGLSYSYMFINTNKRLSKNIKKS